MSRSVQQGLLPDKWASNGVAKQSHPKQVYSEVRPIVLLPNKYE